MLETDLLPWIEAAGDLGADVLEVGPGPGLTTDLLRRRVDRLTAVEIDPSLGEALRDRLADTNVEVIVGCDSLDLAPIRDGHADDTFVPLDPHRLAERLAAHGFTDTAVDVGDYQFRFLARRAA